MNSEGDERSIWKASSRFFMWKSSNAQFLAIALPTTAAIFGLGWTLGSTISTLRKDLAQEKQDRLKDVSQEKELRKTDVRASFAEGKAFFLQQQFTERQHTTQLVFGAEYENERQRTSSKE